MKPISDSDLARLRELEEKASNSNKAEVEYLIYSREVMPALLSTIEAYKRVVDAARDSFGPQSREGQYPLREALAALDSEESGSEG